MDKRRQAWGWRGRGGAYWWVWALGVEGEVVERPLAVWWGPYRGSEQLVEAGAEGWRFVQEATEVISSSTGWVVTDSAIRGEELLAPGATVAVEVHLRAPAEATTGSVLIRAFWNPQDPSRDHRDAVAVEVAGPDPYAAWTFSRPWAAADSAPGADPDGDGLSNLLEYALGSDPLSPSWSRAPAPGLNGRRLSLSFERVADPALTYRVLGSSHLSGWTTVWSSTGVSNQPGRVVVEDAVLLESQPARFLKLEVTLEP